MTQTSPKWTEIKNIGQVVTTFAPITILALAIRQAKEKYGACSQTDYVVEAFAEHLDVFEPIFLINTARKAMGAHLHPHEVDADAYGKCHALGNILNLVFQGMKVRSAKSILHWLGELPEEATLVAREAEYYDGLQADTIFCADDGFEVDDEVAGYALNGYMNKLENPIIRVVLLLALECLLDGNMDPDDVGLPRHHLMDDEDRAHWWNLRGTSEFREPWSAS